MAEEFTAKFKVDISDLKKNIQEANKQIKLANATFKKETAGMTDWTKNADGLDAKLKQLDTTLKEQKSKLSDYRSQLDRQKEAYEKNGQLVEEFKSKLKQLADQGVSKASEEYKKYETALKNAAKEQQNNEKAIDDLNLTILEQEAAVKKTEAEVGKYETALSSLKDEEKAAQEAAKKQKTAYEELESTIDSQQTELNNLKSKYADVVLQQGKSSDAAQELAGEIDKLSGELSDNKKQLQDADSAADDLDKSLEDLSDSSENAGGGFTVMKGALADLVAEGIRMATEAIKDFVSETINVGKEFDSSMSQVAAVSGATGDDLQALRDKAKEMGSTTKFTASEAADAFNYMAMAGWKTEDMLGGISGVLNLAAAGNTDLATTSDIVTDALTAFGQSADDAGRLADIMAAASSNANTNVEMMGETFKYVAPVAGAMGYSMEDSAVAIGLMANAGIKGSQAGTSLRSILTRLAAPPKEAATAMEELGIQITNADGTMKPFSEVIDILRASFDGLSEAEQTQYAKHLAGQEAMSGLLAIVNAAPADFNKLTDAVNNSQGAAESMAETMQDNLGGDLTKLGSQFEGVQLTLYEKFEPALRSGVEALSKMLDGLLWIIEKGSQFVDWLNGGSKAAEAFKLVVITVGAALAGFLAVVAAQAAWTGLISMLGKVKTAFMALSAAMAANPIGLVVAAISALVAAFVYLWNTSEDFRNFWIGLWEKIKNFVSEAVTKISEFFTNLWSGIKEVWSTVSTWFNEKVVQPIVGFFNDLWARATEIWNNIVNSIKDTVSGVASWINENVIQPIVNFFMEFIWPIIDKVAEIVAKICEILVALATFVGTWIKDNIVAPVVDGVKEIYKKVSEWVKKAWDYVVGIWSKVSSWFDEKVVTPVATLFSNLWTGIKNVFANVKSWFSEKFQAAKNAVTNAWSPIANWFSQKYSAIKNVFANVKTWFGNKFGDAWTAIKNKFASWGSFWDGLWTKVKNKFSGIGSNIANAISGSIRSGINGVISMIENTINSAIGLINGAIGLINKLPGVNVGKIGGLSLPRLAQGGVLKKGQVGLLEGDGAEAVVPLDRNKMWVRAVASDMLDELRGQAGARVNTSNMNNSKSMNFTQNFYAPQQPSRIELYRQTKNLLALAERGI